MTATAQPTVRTKPPFRADHVGSLLRPDSVKHAREQFLGPQTPQSSLGPHDNAELRAVEDAAVRDLIAMQEDVGLRAVTDGELRRRSWWLELILGWDGFEADRTGNTKIRWRNADRPDAGLLAAQRHRPDSLAPEFDRARVRVSQSEREGDPQSHAARAL